MARDRFRPFVGIAEARRESPRHTSTQGEAMSEPTKAEIERAMQLARAGSGYSTGERFSTVTLSDGPKGPFTIQDEATKTCCDNIAAAIRKGDF